MRAAAWILLVVGLTSPQAPADKGRPPLQKAPYRIAQELTQGTREAAGSVMEVARQAVEVATTSSNWQGPCLVRLELLQRQASLLQSGQGDIDRYLRFFSVSRQVFWLSNPPLPVASKIRELESASQRLAQSAGRNLDLPPISASALAPPPDPGAPPTPLPTAVQLKESVRVADSLAQSIWSDVRNQALPPGGDTLALRARQDLVGIAETLQNLRVALEEGGDARSRWRNFNENRIRFLASHSRLPQLDQRLPRLLQALEELGENGRRTFGN